MARDKTGRPEPARMAELSKNLAELNQLSGASTRPPHLQQMPAPQRPPAGSQSGGGRPCQCRPVPTVAPAQTNANPEAPATAEQAPTAPQATPQEAAPCSGSRGPGAQARTTASR